MRILPRLLSLWNTLFRKDRVERELDDEIRGTVQLLADRYAASGMEPSAARHQAVRSLGGPGGIVRVKEETLDGRIGAGLDALLVDVRHAWRSLRKARGVTAVIVLTLALGIGANTAIFSVVHALLLAPLPYRDADRLVFVWLDRTWAGYPRGPMSGPDIRDLREGTSTFSAFGGIWATGAIALTGEGEPEQLRSAFVTTNFFDVLGATAALGRTFRPEDSAKGAEPTILIGWDLFQRRFGGDPSIVGRRIHLDSGLVTVIGVMPNGFRLLLPSDASVPDRLQAWTPFWPDLESGPRRNLFLRVIGRMRPDVSLAAAREDINGVGRRISRTIGSNRSFTTVALQEDDVREIRGSLLVLFTGVGLLLLIACVNVAGLLIARAASRHRETALRLALGAGRGRLLRQSLIEGLLLTLLGIGAGVAVGHAGLRALLALAPPSLSRLESSHINTTVLAFTLGISVAWGLLFSLAPMTEIFAVDAIAAARPRRSLFRRAAGRGYRTRAGLVVLQIAMSVVLLVGAGLLVRAFVHVLRVDPGFRADRRMTFRLAIPGRFEYSDAFNLFADELRRRVAAIPGVTSVGAISHLPYDDLPNWGLPYASEAPIPPDAPMADARAISPGLFETLGVPVIEGRLFTDNDKDGRNPVVVIDDMLARQLWPQRSALGQHIISRVSGDGRAATIVGVVRHLRLRSLVDNLSPQIFVPWKLAQRNPIAFVVQTVRDPASLTGDIRAAVAAADPRLPIYDARPLQTYAEAARSMRRFTMLLAAAFAASALLLACVGVYGVLAYAVTHRRHEFGVRRALGADTGQVMRDVLRQGLGFALVGILGGLAGALAIGQFLQSQLYLVHPRDPLTFAAAIALIFSGAIVACWLPAYRATTISPMDALRTE